MASRYCSTAYRRSSRRMLNAALELDEIVKQLGTRHMPVPPACARNLAQLRTEGEATLLRLRQLQIEMRPHLDQAS